MFLCKFKKKKKKKSTKKDRMHRKIRDGGLSKKTNLHKNVFKNKKFEKKKHKIK
jgi:hypothetical protein